MTRTASLGMYDHAALHAANDALWRAIATRLRAAGIADVPDALDRTRPLEAIWDDPQLLLAQTCGYPLVTRWDGRLRYVATPRYDVTGCEGAWHRSRIVVRRDDGAEALTQFRGRTVALNDRHSNTGMNLLRDLVAPLAEDGLFFGAIVETGSHAESARLVAEGGADIAAIDTVTFAHLERDRPDIVAGLRTLGWTAAAPGLPLVTATSTSPGTVRALRTAIAGAIHDSPADAALLRLDGIEVIGRQRYRTIGAIERRAVRKGYPQLA